MLAAVPGVPCSMNEDIKGVLLYSWPWLRRTGGAGAAAGAAWQLALGVRVGAVGKKDSTDVSFEDAL